MNDLGVELFYIQIELFLEKCRELETHIKNDTVTQQMTRFESEWTELYKQYQSLVCYGYANHEDFLAVKGIMEKVKAIQQANTAPTKKKQLFQSYFQQIIIHLGTEKFELKWIKKDPKRPFLVDFWTWTLQRLEMLSLFYFIRNLFWPKFTKGNFRFVDAWLFGHTILALIYVFIANVEAVPLVVKYTLLIYGCMRMFEILIYQLNVILVHPYNSSNYSLNSYRRMTIALIHNFIEIIFWFAGTFITLQFITDSTVPLAVYTSFTHMVTYSMNLDDSKWTILAIFILQFQAAIGVFMTVLSLARFVSLFPQPASQDPAEQEANEVRHAKLIEEITYLKATVEKNSARIMNNKREIDQMHEKETPTHEVARTGGKA